MPDKFVVLDTGIPQWNGEETLTEKVDALYSHQFQLVESLRYMLRHLDMANFDEAGLKSITEPISISIRDDFDELSMSISGKGIEGVLTGLENTLSLFVTSDRFNATIETLDDEISSMELTQEEFNVFLKDPSTGYSQLSVDVSGISGTVADLTTGMTTTLHLSGTGLKIGSSTGKSTTISGSNITTGTITATQIKANAITGNEIAANTITGSNIKAGTITATQIDATNLKVSAANVTGTITAGALKGNTVTIYDGDAKTAGTWSFKYGSTYALDLTANTGFRVTASGDIYLDSAGAALLVGRSGTASVVSVLGNLVLGSGNYGTTLPLSGVTGQVFFLRA